MATETKCRVTRARYGGYRADYVHDGEWKRTFFNTSKELASRLAISRVDADTIEAVAAEFENVEDSPPVPHPDDEPPMWALYLRAVVWIGFVAAPWFGLTLLIRWAMGDLR